MKLDYDNRRTRENQHGSLGPDALQQAYSALAGISGANRLVGVISHVAELKEKIDRQIIVVKEKTGGSHVTLQL